MQLAVRVLHMSADLLQSMRINRHDYRPSVLITSEFVAMRMQVEKKGGISFAERSDDV